ncbi:DUF1573 domain-containing protein [Flavobacteriaceae bacterium]|jgi:uncharacterized membrane protein|nr:DUF1573 domain-containing protein [Flavobacteriaceae bacterium]MDB4196598.1 DUF1573 domain-containing protein [Flavobacteriaceae bacterium]MDC0623041.1 DUF1573 domain-containing protein [Flavobacteriaceae bacterium]|tara:strand:+ start:73 stop:585 length:513 start_codon:yes stop_codon:yes gene_type:complete
MNIQKNTLKSSAISFFVAFTITFLLTSCGNDPFSKVETKNVEVASQRDAVATNFAEMTFDKTSHDFGTINDGQAQETMFSYTNTGDTPLVVTDIKSTCGCTVPQGWSRQPLSPGESSQFTVKFNGKGANKVSKTVTVTANTKKGRETVRISAFINNPRSVKQPLLPKINQ